MLTLVVLIDRTRSVTVSMHTQSDKINYEIGRQVIPLIRVERNPVTFGGGPETVGY